VADVPGLQKIVLREYEIKWRGGLNNSMIRRSDDIYAAALEREKPAFPESGIVVRASLDFYFDGQKKPRRVQVKTPNTLKLGRHCDARLVHEWLSARGFRASEISIAAADSGANEVAILAGDRQ